MGLESWGGQGRVSRLCSELSLPGSSSSPFFRGREIAHRAERMPCSGPITRPPPPCCRETYFKSLAHRDTLEGSRVDSAVQTAEKSPAEVPGCEGPHVSGTPANHGARLPGRKWALWAARCQADRLGSCCVSRASDERSAIEWGPHPRAGRRVGSLRAHLSAGAERSPGGLGAHAWQWCGVGSAGCDSEDPLPPP